MRKIYLLVLCTVFTLSSALVSCGDSNDPTENSGFINPDEPSASEAMSPASQKEYLDVVAKEFMDETKASDFNAIADLYNYVSDTYTDNYDWDAVDQWGSDIYESLRESLGTTDMEQDKSDWGVCNYIYTNYKAVLVASNFTGHFTATNGKWTLTKANDLQFIFNDILNSCPINLTLKTYIVISIIGHYTFISHRNIANIIIMTRMIIAPVIRMTSRISYLSCLYRVLVPLGL